MMIAVAMGMLFPLVLPKGSYQLIVSYAVSHGRSDNEELGELKLKRSSFQFNCLIDLIMSVKKYLKTSVAMVLISHAFIHGIGQWWEQSHN